MKNGLSALLLGVCTACLNGHAFAFPGPLPRLLDTNSDVRQGRRVFACQVTFESPSIRTVLSHDPHVLAQVLEGKGRARSVWRSIAEGLDPLTTDRASELYDVRVTDKTRLLAQRRTRSYPWTATKVTQSSCGTRKFLLRLEDHMSVETVIIPSISRSTVCVSSQVGCNQGCRFCATGTMGLIRNLSIDEILAQIQLALQVTRQERLPPLRNVVYMGMGEPLVNADAVSGAVRILTDPLAFAFSPNFVTVSTVAPSPAAVARLAHMPAKIAWSVHAADNELRRKLVPTTRYSMEELRDSFVAVMDERGDDEIFIEVTMIDGVNDGDRHAEELIALLSPLGQRVKLNLIPYNYSEGTLFPFNPSPMQRILEFQATIRWLTGWPVFVRTPRGRMEGAACGQLATEDRRRSLKAAAKQEVG